MPFTHLDSKGKAKMVDVSDKKETSRVAVAKGKILLKPDTIKAILEQEIKKGDVLTVAKIGGIMAAKQCSNLIPLCHQIPLTNVDIKFEIDKSSNCINIISNARTCAKTGVEMEALTAVSVAGLIIYDMCKAIDKGMIITEICLLKKKGGRSGHWERSKNSITSPQLKQF